MLSLAIFSSPRRCSLLLSLLKSLQWKLAADGAWTCSPRRWPMQKCVAISEQLQRCSQTRGTSLCPLCALEILILVFTLPALPTTLSDPSNFTHLPAAPLSTWQLLFADTLFDLLVCFQLFSPFKVTYFVKLFNAYVHLILVPLYLIYVEYHICLFLWMGNVFAYKLLCILKVLGKK